MGKPDGKATDGPVMRIVMDHLWAYGRTRALQAGVELGLFDALADGPATAAGLSKAIRARERGVRMLADTLCALDLLTKSRAGYELTPTARTFLVTSSPACVGAMVLHTRLHQHAWDNLAETVRTGKPTQSVDLESGGREFFPKLVAAIFSPSFGASTMARELLGTRVTRRVTDVLDVAGGAGSWSMPWAVANPAVRVTLLDYEEVFPVAREYATRFGVADRYAYKAGNLRKVSFGRAACDLVLLGHICHSEGAVWSEKLIRKSFDALRPGGTLVIGEFVPNDERTGPVNQMLFGLNMLVNTVQGDVFTLAEYRRWMRAAGFSGIRKLDFGADGPDVIVGTKKA